MSDESDKEEAVLVSDEDEEQVARRNVFLDEMVQRALDELTEGKTETRVASLIMILAGGEVHHREALPRIKLKLGDSKAARAVERCFWWPPEEREADERRRAMTDAAMPPPPPPAVTSVVATTSEASTGLVSTAGGKETSTEVTASTSSEAPVVPTPPAPATSSSSATVSGAATGESALVSTGEDVPEAEPHVAASSAEATVAGGEVESGGAVASRTSAASAGREPEVPAASESDARTEEYALSPMDVDAVELHPMTDVVMPVSPEPVKTVTVKAPSEPLPPGMRFVKKTPKVIDVRTDAGRGDRKSGAGGATVESGGTGGTKKVDKRRHSRMAPCRESRRDSSPDRKSSSSRHSAHHSSSDRSAGGKRKEKSRSRPSSSRRGSRSAESASKRRRKSVSPKSAKKKTGGSGGGRRSTPSKAGASSAKPKRTPSPRAGAGTAAPEVSGESASKRKSKSAKARRRRPSGRETVPSGSESVLAHAVGGAISAAKAFTSAIVTCAALSLATTLSTVVTSSTADSGGGRLVSKAGSRKAARTRTTDAVPATPGISSVGPSWPAAASAMVSSAVGGMVRATGSAFGTHAITPGAASVCASVATPKDPTRPYRRHMDFPRGAITRDMLRHALDTDRNGGYVDYVSPQDCHDPLERKVLPSEVILSRQMPFRVQYLPTGTADTEDMWHYAWRDNYTHWELSRADFRALSRMDGACHQMELFLDGKQTTVTVHPACGHLSAYEDFHVFCRTCQICCEGKLCCTGARSLCPKGRALWTTDRRYCAGVTESRSLTLEYIRDRGRRLRVLWLGDRKELEFSVVRRLAYAVGYGASGVEPELRRMLALCKDVGPMEDIVHELRELALEERTQDIQPIKSVLVVPLYACGRKGYMRQMERLVGKLPSLTTMLKDYTPEAAAEAKLLAATLGRPATPAPSPAVFPTPTPVPLAPATHDASELSLGSVLPVLDVSAVEAAIACADAGEAVRSRSAPIYGRPGDDAADAASRAVLVPADHLPGLLASGDLTTPRSGTGRPSRVASAPPYPLGLSSGLSSPEALSATRASRHSRGDASDTGASDWEMTSHGSSHASTLRSQPPISTIPSLDEQITIGIPTGPEGPYLQAVNDHRLCWWADDAVPRRVLGVFKQRPEAVVEEPNVLPLHNSVHRAVDASERARRSHFDQRRDAIPSSVAWETPASQSRMYGARSHRIAARPPPLHPIHLHGTPNTIMPQSIMPVTYEALLFQEEMSRVTVHDTSVQCHAVDNARAALDEAIGELGAPDVLLRLQDRMDDLARTSERCVTNSVESMLAAAYHRRYAVLYGGDPVTIKRLMQNSLVSTTNVNGVQELVRDTGAPVIKTEPEEVVIIEPDGRASVIRAFPSAASSPVIEPIGSRGRVSRGDRAGTSGSARASASAPVGKLDAYVAAGLAPLAGMAALPTVTRVTSASASTGGATTSMAAAGTGDSTATVSTAPGSGDAREAVPAPDVRPGGASGDGGAPPVLPVPPGSRPRDDDTLAEGDSCEFFLTQSSPTLCNKVSAICDRVLRTPSDLVDIEFQNCVLTDNVSFVVCNGSSNDLLSEEPVP